MEKLEISSVRLVVSTRISRVGKDDVLDALVAAVTAYRGYDDLKQVPGSGDEDKKGLTMEIVYWNPPKG